ncbi:MAG: MFS transporter [Proteobacteria bacterium]|nr:MFS transporter [Pseudomonadota bacterium]
MSSTFRSLRVPNYRLWAAGALVSNVGTWMQRTAQDWLVLMELTHRSATDLGIVVSLQFGPQLLLLPLTGLAADRLNRRRLLLATQGTMGALALALGALTLAHAVQLWHVYGFAFLLGCAAAFDAPARHAFVGELVGRDDLPNAVALNATSFHAGRMVGPAIAGLLIAGIGSGWVFVLNGLSFIGVLIALTTLKRDQLHAQEIHARRGGLAEGLRYVWQRPDLRAILAMVFLVGTFGFNFPIFISTMSVGAFHGGPSQFGVLSSAIAIGSVTGGLLAARRRQVRMAMLPIASTLFGFGCIAAAVAPNPWLFALPLVLVGISAQTLSTSANSLVQLGSDPALRGRVLAILLATLLGSTPLGAPLVGWVADRCGPRWAMAVGAASGFAAAFVAYRYYVRHRGLRIRFEDRRLRWSLADGADAAEASVAPAPPHR